VLRQSPQLEGFAKRGIEVLLLCDHVDDFWVNVVNEYKGKSLKSVTRADIDLDKLDDAKDETKDEDKKPEDEASVQALCARIKEILGDNIKDVRTTSKLSNSAVCLAVEEGAMDFRLERFLIEQKTAQHGVCQDSGGESRSCNHSLAGCKNFGGGIYCGC
jgi:molecular chaperone HtpG